MFLLEYGVRDSMGILKALFSGLQLLVLFLAGSWINWGWNFPGNDSGKERKRQGVQKCTKNSIYNDGL